MLLMGMLSAIMVIAIKLDVALWSGMEQYLILFPFQSLFGLHPHVEIYVLAG